MTESMIVILIACGTTAGIVASNKGRSVAGWCFLGVLLGPVGVLMALVVARNEAEIESRAVASGESRKCPHCAELVKAQATTCKHCGKDIEPMPAPAPHSADNLPRGCVRLVVIWNPLRYGNVVCFPRARLMGRVPRALGIANTSTANSR